MNDEKCLNHCYYYFTQLSELLNIDFEAEYQMSLSEKPKVVEQHIQLQSIETNSTKVEKKKKKKRRKRKTKSKKRLRKSSSEQCINDNSETNSTSVEAISLKDTRVAHEEPSALSLTNSTNMNESASNTTVEEKKPDSFLDYSFEHLSSKRIYHYTQLHTIKPYSYYLQNENDKTSSSILQLPYNDPIYIYIEMNDHNALWFFDFFTETSLKHIMNYAPLEFVPFLKLKLDTKVLSVLEESGYSKSNPIFLPNTPKTSYYRANLYLCGYKEIHENEKKVEYTRCIFSKRLIMTKRVVACLAQIHIEKKLKSIRMCLTSTSHLKYVYSMYSQLQSSTRMIHHMNQNVTMLYYKGYAGIANGDHFEQVLCDRYQGHVPSFCGTSQLVAISNSSCSFCRKKSFKEESRKSSPIVIHINIHPNCYYSNLFVVNQLSFVLLREQYILVYSLMLLELFLLICTSIPLVVSL